MVSDSLVWGGIVLSCTFCLVAGLAGVDLVAALVFDLLSTPSGFWMLC